MLSLPLAAAFVTALAARLVNEDSPHRFGSRPEEMGPAIPVRAGVVAHETQIRFVHECRGLKGLPGLFLRESAPRQASATVINERQQLSGS